MAKIEQFICDECGTVKQSTNHWWNVIRSDQLIFRHFERDHVTAAHICGHACAQKVLERWMAEQRS